jgi:Holliday junction resolvasome RuvABC ATP-dependent DNA helicase subunit
MDTNEHVIILATNDIAELPEALVNRCEDLIFEAYSQEELHYIATLYLPFNLSVECLDYLIESSGYNPRIIKHTAGKLILVFSKHPELVNSTLEEFKYLLESVFGIKDGMDVMCTRYLEALTNVGGTASLQTISSYTHIDQSTMKYFIEPILLYKNRIRISSRGRSLTTNDDHN